MTAQPDMEKGLQLPVIETFYSIQGEGFHAGKAAYFIRIGGCDIGCKWGDTKFSWQYGDLPLTPVSTLIKEIKATRADTLVVTGGEPLLYNLNPLCEQMHAAGIATFLETSGSHPLSGQWNWICLSPKPQAPPQQQLYMLADELKIIIQDKGDFVWAEENAQKITPQCRRFLQPEWSQYKKLIPLVVDYVLNHPEWEISLQNHKFMNIP